MIYALIGRLVVKGVRVFLRRMYGPTYTPKPVLAGGAVLALAGLALAAAKQQRDS